MADDVTIRLGVDSPEAERKLDAVLRKIEETGQALDRSSKGAASYGGVLSGELSKAKDHLVGVVAGVTGVAGAIKAGTIALEEMNAELERMKRLGEESAAALGKIADKRQGAVLDAAKRFGGAKEVDRIAALLQGEGIDKGTAYGIISTSADLDSKMPTRALESAMRETAKLTRLRGTNDPTATVGAIARTMQATGVGTGAQAFGFMSQFAESPNEQAALAGVLQVAADTGNDPRQAATLFQKFAEVQGNPEAAAEAVKKLMIREGFQGGVRSGTRFDPKSGTRKDTRVEVTGGSLFDRLESLAGAFRGATPDQRSDYSSRLGIRGGGTEQASFFRMLQNPSEINELRKAAAGAATPGGAGGNALDIYEMLRSGIGGEIETHSRTGAAIEAASLERDTERKQEELRGALAASIRQSGLPGFQKSILLGRIGKADGPFGYGERMASFLTDQTFEKDAAGTAEYVMNQVRSGGPATSGQSQLIDAITELIKEVRASRDERMNTTTALRSLNSSINKAGNAPKGPRSGEVQ